MLLWQNSRITYKICALTYNMYITYTELCKKKYYSIILKLVSLPSFCLFLAAVANGETDTATAESWEEKGEPDEVEAGGGAMEESGPVREEAQEEMMIEEDEEMPAPKLPPPLPDAPKKEHVNVVFIGHVGASVTLPS